MYIKNAVLHMVDPNMKGVLLNNVELPIGTNKDVTKMIESLVKSLLRNKNLRSCRYKDFTDSEVRKLVEDTLYYDENFIVNSQKIAELLHGAGRKIKNLGATDFLVVKYMHADKEYMACFCLEYTEIYTNRVSDNDGQAIIELSKNDYAHTKKPKFHLGFSAGVSGMNDVWNMLVLDKDAAKRNTDSDFMELFLGVDKVEDSRYLTEKFISIVKGWTSNNYKDNLNGGLQLMYALSTLADMFGNFSYEDFAEDYIPEDLKRKSFLLTMAEHEIPKEFEIDSAYAVKALKKIRLKNSGFVISLKLEDIRELYYKEHENSNADLLIRSTGEFEYM